jgi:hypothetical protein
MLRLAKIVLSRSLKYQRATSRKKKKPNAATAMELAALYLAVRSATTTSNVASAMEPATATSTAMELRNQKFLLVMDSNQLSIIRRGAMLQSDESYGC